MTLAEDTRPEANWQIDLRLYALQRHTWCEYETDVSLSTLAEYQLFADLISDAMLNSHITGKAINSEELLILYCDKH